MRILVIGGTRFIGRYVVASALDAGHEITLFHRGQSGTELFPEAERRLGDRDADLSALAEGEWDATVDTCAFLPRQVHTLADALGERAGHYELVSSVSAYAGVEAGFREDAPLATLDDPSVEEMTDETYGGLKVLCEQAATERFGDRSLLIRPTYVIGPHDYSWRFPYWVNRIARGGEVLAPGPEGLPSQVIDVRDMAAWMVGLLESGTSGPFHAAGPSPTSTWGEQLATIESAVAPSGTNFTWMAKDFLVGHGLDDSTLPLWPAVDPEPLMMTADSSAAVATGLRMRPLEESVRDTHEWISSEPAPPERGTLSAARERELLDEWHAVNG